MAPSLLNSWQRPLFRYLLLGSAILLIWVHLFGGITTFKSTETFAVEIKPTQASYLKPAELFERKLPGGKTSISRLIHQSWKTDELPFKFKRWSESWRKAHPDWEWVLWTDNDNEELLRRFMPSMLPAYQSLNAPIFRADLARYAYLYLFGGVYADLDMECLQDTTDLFLRFNVTTSTTGSSKPDWSLSALMTQEKTRSTNKRLQRAFVGRMEAEEYWDEHSIPNAWFAGPPGHPFFGIMLHWIKQRVTATSTAALDARPEAITGPIALKKGIERFESLGKGNATHLENWTDILATPPPPANPRMIYDVTVLPPKYIYPYSWAGPGGKFRDLCSSAWSSTFDATKCKEKIQKEVGQSYAITYWSHTWNNDGTHEENVQKMSSES